MAHYFTFDMLFERYGRENRVVTEEDREELRKNREFYAKVAHEEDIGSDESIPDTDDEQDFQEIKDPRQAADAVNKVLEEIIQSPASKKICGVHHLDHQILTKVLGNLKDSIAQETLNQLTNRRLQLQQAPDSAATTLNKEMTQLPASNDDDDDEKSLKNLITQETSINLQNVSEQGEDGKHVDAGGVDLGSQAEAGGVIMDLVEGVCSTKDDINSNDSVDIPTSKTLGIMDVKASDKLKFCDTDMT
ncbi:hypothetical protein P8452_54012 [Trifolium repens]|nr:hypothetical protein P8452_54012 [Trifolium repens]